MFHQPNLRHIDMDEYTINNVTDKFSLISMWVKTITDELVRLCDWPIITLRHDHIAQSFNRRMTRDACKPVIQYHMTNQTITGVTIRATGGRVTGSQLGNLTITEKSNLLNDCPAPIPVTFPRGTNITAFLTSAHVNNATMYVDQQVILAGVGMHTTQIGNDPITAWVRLAGQPVSLNISQSTTAGQTSSSNISLPLSSGQLVNLNATLNSTR